MKNVPILVTGAHRSGTTWIGRVLSSAPNVVYLREAFNLNHPSDLCLVRFPHWFQYIHEGNEHEYYEPIRNMLELKYPFSANWKKASSPISRLKIVKNCVKHLGVRYLKSSRVLLKDPIAVMSAEWLCNAFDMDVVVTIRHPAAFVASLKRLGWDYAFERFERQPELMRSYIEKFSLEIQKPPTDIVGQAILLWRIIYHVVKNYRTRHPEWLYLRHEDVSARPEAEFREIFKRLDLKYTSYAHSQVLRYSSEDNPKRTPEGKTRHLFLNSKANIFSWKDQLTAEEISRIRSGTEDIYYEFYTDDDWKGPRVSQERYG